MNILVTGGGGVVAGYFRAACGAAEVLGRNELDITDLAAVQRRVEAGRYRVIVNLAAATDLDRCEADPEWAYRVNTAGARNLALAARASGARMVQVSTIGVFGGDGAPGPFSEIDPPRPPNVYARSKLAAEAEVRALDPMALVVRTAWVMGGAERDTKFVGKIRARLLAGAPIQAVEDIAGSPTYAADLVQGILALLEIRAHGLYHLTNGGSASRLEIAVKARGILGSRSEITAVKASTFPLPAPRASERSRSLALPAVGLDKLMRPWREALAAYLKTW